ncbi:MAG: class I SAM-dependent methyltransferase [Candidatus Muiribacteriota bacterium]
MDKILCGVCHSVKNKKINHTLFICCNCGHVFEVFEPEKSLEYEKEKEKLIIKKMHGKNIFKDFEKDDFEDIEIYNTLEFTPHPQALIFDIYRIIRPGGRGKLIVSKRKKSLHYFSYTELEKMFKEAGFKVKNPLFFNQLINVFTKKIRIKFIKPQV